MLRFWNHLRLLCLLVGDVDLAKAAKTALTNVWEKKAGGPITRDTLPGLENSKKLKPAEITQIKKLLDQAEGIQ